MSPPSSPDGTTKDFFLDGQVTLTQPARPAHRAGSDAVFLAATVRGASGKALDMGAGCGAVGILAAHQNPDLSVDLAENDPLQLACARQSIENNTHLKPVLRLIEADLLSDEADRIQSGLARESYDFILSNPPYRWRGRVRTDAARLAAHTISDEEADQWMRCAAAHLKPGGVLCLIFASEGIELLLSILRSRFGDMRILGLHPREGVPAERILIRAIKGRRSPPSILPGLILHDREGGYTPDAAEILSGTAAIDMVKS